MMSREAVLRELRSVSKRELAQILKPLGVDEREQVLALIKPSPQVPSRVPFATLMGLSPWLLKAIEPVKSDRANKLTPAARDALAAALERLASEQVQAGPVPKKSGTFIGRLLSARRAEAR